MCCEKIEDETFDTSYLFVLGLAGEPKKFNKEEWENIKDPNGFLGICEYELYISDNGWFIKEKLPGKLFPHILLIDHNGKFSQFKNLEDD